MSNDRFTFAGYADEGGNTRYHLGLHMSITIQVQLHTVVKNGRNSFIGPGSGA